MYSDNDWRNYLEHSWGTSPKQKEREREYNHQYWLNNRERILFNRAQSTARYINSMYNDSAAGMDQARNRAASTRKDSERTAANQQYMENLGYHNRSVQMRNAMNMYAKKPVNDLEQFIANSKAKIDGFITKVKNTAINFYTRNEQWIGWGKKKPTGSNTPTNQSDLNTIARERAKQTINSTGTGFTRTFSGTQTTVGEARRRNPGGR